jgi:Ca2+/Na+ antiporter
MDASNATGALPHVNYTLGCRPYASPSLAAACAHVTNNPLCEHGDIDYLRFYYCSDGFVGAAPPALKLPILALWGSVLFVAIATVADNYFAPAVERISARLGLPEDVAGATLLALGGAAPDIFTQAAALLESDTPDLRLALSESVGAGLFVSNLGKALAVLVGLSRGGRVFRRQDSNPRSRGPEDVVTVEAFPYLRDCLMYAVMLLVAYASILDGVISTGEAATFVALYALYVALVLRGRTFFGLEDGDDTGRSPRSPRTGAETAARKNQRATHAKADGDVEAPAAEDDLEEGTADVELADMSELHRRKERDHAEHGLREDAPEKFAAVKFAATTTERDDDEADEGDDDEEGTMGLLAGADGVSDAKRRSACEDGAFANQTSWVRSLSGIDDASYGVFFAAARAPVALVMALTMLPVDARARVPPAHLAAVVVFAPLFFLWAANLLAAAVAAAPAAFWIGYLVWILAWWRIVLRRCPTGGIDTKKSNLAQALAFAQGIMWMHACADELVGLFQAAGRAAGVRESLLGATVMAWGASAGDLGGMLAMARAGYARMAITASLAGPVCQLSIGTGFSMLLVRFRGEAIRADFADNMRFFTLYGVAASVAFAVIVPRLGFALDRRAAFVVMGCYAVAVGVFVALALDEEER